MKDIYKTDDINLTSFLLTNSGIDLIGLQEDEPRHYLFLLSSSKKCTELHSKYINNTKAPVLDLFSKKEMLITQIKRKSQEALPFRVDK